MAIEDKKLLASDGAGGDDFGYSVSMSEDYVVIGAPFDDILYPNQGAAYVFVRSGTGWTQQAKLTAFDGGANDQFGYSVSISGDYAVIGAYGDDTPFTNQGSAYVFVRSGTTWAQQIKLIASDGADNDRFGNSVSISGDYVVVGSNGDDSNKGSAYVFVRSASTWSQQAKLTASDGGAGDYFGNSVSISGDYVVIGAYLDDLGLNINQGSVYVFARSFNTWPFQVKLTDSAGAASDNFGSSVSISGDYVIIGAPGDDESFADQGSAYIFMRSGNTWSQQTKLTASDGVGYDHFGNSVSISGDYAVIGAINDDNQGSAYVFVQSGTAWTLQTKLTASDGTTGDNFGYSVSISGDNVVIGVYLDDISSFIDQGSAYVFRKK
jgi:hypothetical protein